MSLEPSDKSQLITNQESLGNSGRSIESNGKTYTFFSNFEPPNNRLRENVRDNPDNPFYQQLLNQATNRMLFEGELMRRGFTVLPADEVMAKQNDGRDLATYLSIFVADDLDKKLFNNFREAVKNSIPEALDFHDGGHVVMNPGDISELMDKVLMQDEYQPLLDYYHAHMERVRDLGGSATAPELI